MTYQRLQAAIADIVKQLVALEDMIADPDVDLALCDQVFSRCQTICAALSPPLTSARDAARADRQLSARTVTSISQLGWALDSLTAQFASTKAPVTHTTRDLLSTALNLARRVQALTPDGPPRDNIIDVTPHLRARADSRRLGRSAHRGQLSNRLYEIREVIASTELSADCHLSSEGREQLSRALYQALYQYQSDAVEAG